MKNKRALETVNRIVETYADDKQKQIRALRRLVRDGQKAGDVLLVGAAYYYIGIAYIDLGDQASGVTNTLKAAALLQDTDAYELYLKAHIALGYTYSEQENDQMALVHSDKALEILRRHRIGGSSRIIATNNLSTCYHSMGNCKESIRLLNECLSLIRAETPEDRDNLMMCSLNLADCYRDDGSPEKAQELLERMEDWIDKADTGPLVCDYWLRRGIIAWKLGEQETGSQCVERAFALMPEGVYPTPLYDDLRQISHLLVKNGAWEPARRVFDLMTDYAENNKGTVEQIIACRTFADFYKYAGELERAAEIYERLDGLNEKRTGELKGARLNFYQRMKNADVEIRRLHKRMQESETQASLEPMTKLLNRSALLTVSSEFIETAARKKQKVGAVFIDIDFFKECNDTYGHAKGDEIIRQVADACRREETAAIRFARYGGDEFFGIARGLTDAALADVARRIARRIREADIPNEKNPNGQRITLSIGLVNVPVHDRTDTIIEIAGLADKALYHAKSAGKDAVYLLDRVGADKKGKNADYVKIDV